MLVRCFRLFYIVIVSFSLAVLLSGCGAKASSPPSIPPTLQSLAITPANYCLVIGHKQQLVATGTFSDGTSRDLTSSVTWSSSEPSVATIDNLGWVNGVGLGTTSISASSGALQISTSVEVDDQLLSINVAPQNPIIFFGATQQFTATATYASGAAPDITNQVSWTSSVGAVASIGTDGMAISQAGGQTSITAALGSVDASTTLTVGAVPTNLRVDISVGTTGQLFVSWDSAAGASYYTLQRSTDPNSGYSTVAQCSGKSNLKSTYTTTAMMACRDGGLIPGTSYYYQVQACYSNGCTPYSTAASNVAVTSDCTEDQIPNTVGTQTLPPVVLVSSVVDPAIQFLPDNNQFAYYASPSVPRRNLLVVDLPGSDETCPGAGAFNVTAEKLGFDVLCVNYSNLSSQHSICAGDTSCFGDITQAKFDATGLCSVPGQSGCGIDPKTHQPFYLSNPADAVTQRVSMMLQYLNTHGYNQNGANWGAYLSGTTPLWQNIILAGHSQGGDMATFAAYKQIINRAINLSAPPQATLMNGVPTAADYFCDDKATDVRNIYGLVSVYDPLYPQGIYGAVWRALGFTDDNNDTEVKLNTSTPIGLNCNTGIPSHNFSTSAPAAPAGGHNTPLYLWNEDVFKFMLID